MARISRRPGLRRRLSPLLAVGALLLATPGVCRAERDPGWPRCVTRPLPDAPGPSRGEARDHDPTLRHDLEALLVHAVATRVTERAAAVVVHRGRVIFKGGAGGANEGSIFDLASLTKVVVTAPLIMDLVSRGRVHLGDPVSKYLPLMDTDNKRAITVVQLLTHTSGLPSVVWAGPMTDGRARVLARIHAARPRFGPGERWGYSDTGFIVLGELAAALGGAPLDRLARKILDPLGMCDSGFRPPPRTLARVVSPWPDGGKEGQVYDPLAHRLGGVSGHAGLFSSAMDLARFGQMMLGGGALDGVRVLSRQAVAAMIRPRALPRGAGHRGLGWDIDSPYAGSRGGLSHQAYGHTGFTGTSLWIDPVDQLVLVLLTNRTRRRPARSVNGLRRRFHDLVRGALAHPPARLVMTGLDVLEKDHFKQLRGKKVVLLTNRAAVDREGRWAGEILATAPGVLLTALLTPEHGLSARVDRHVADQEVTVGGRGVRVFSLYGKRRRPGDRSLAGADTLVVDLPTVGVRTYTYLATVGWAMEEAARRDVRVMVLDRPDPLGGLKVQGPVSSPGRLTSTNYYPLPVRYGMTLGELCAMYNAERKIHARLEVVRVQGWRRGQTYPRTGLPWRNPSPNIRSFRQALLYAGVGLLESTNLAVGRGTESPFQVVGAPWIQGQALAREVNRFRLRGVVALPTRFTPRSSTYRGKSCQGVRLLVTDPRRLRPPTLGLALALALRKLHAKQWDTHDLYRLWSHPPTIKAIQQGRGLKETVATWRGGLKRFMALRKKYVIY